MVPVRCCALLVIACSCVVVVRVGRLVLIFLFQMTGYWYLITWLMLSRVQFEDDVSLLSIMANCTEIIVDMVEIFELIAAERNFGCISTILEHFDLCIISA